MVLSRHAFNHEPAFLFNIFHSVFPFQHRSWAPQASNPSLKGSLKNTNNIFVIMNDADTSREASVSEYAEGRWKVPRTIARKWFFFGGQRFKSVLLRTAMVQSHATSGTIVLGEHADIEARKGAPSTFESTMMVVKDALCSNQILKDIFAVLKIA